jgi:hypothetical protein
LSHDRARGRGDAQARHLAMIPEPFHGFGGATVIRAVPLAVPRLNTARVQ